MGKNEQTNNVNANVRLLDERRIQSVTRRTTVTFTGQRAKRQRTDNDNDYFETAISNRIRNVRKPKYFCEFWRQLPFARQVLQNCVPADGSVNHPLVEPLTGSSSDRAATDQ